MSWPPLLSSLSLRSGGGCMQRWLFRAGYAPASFSKRAANLPLETAPRALCLKSPHTFLLPLSSLRFSLINQQLLMIKIIKERNYSPELGIHWIGCVTLPASMQEKKRIKTDFDLTKFLIALACCMSQINQEHHYVCWWVVPWKFEANKGAWSSKLDYSNGPYLQNMLKSCRTSQNTAEKRDSRNTHTIPPSLWDYLLYIYSLWREPIFICPRCIQGHHMKISQLHETQSASALMTHQEFSEDHKTTPKHCGRTGNWTIPPVA